MTLPTSTLPKNTGAGLDDLPPGVPPRTPASWKKRITFTLGIVLAVALFARLGAGLDWPGLQRSAAAVPAWVWIVGVVGILATYALRAARLQTEWGPRTGAGYGECLQLFLMHNAAVSLLPLRSGELGYAWWLLRRWQVPLSESLASLLWLRLQDAVVLAWLALAGLSPLPGVWGPVLALVLAVAAAWGVPPWWKRWQARWPVESSDAGSGRVARATRKLINAWRASRGGGRAWAYCVANWVLKLAIAALLLQAVGGLETLTAWRGALGGEWAAVLPVQGPAGLGTYEAGVWVGALAGRSESAVPMTSAQVVGTALVVHVLWLATSASAALLAWAFSRGPARAKV